MSHWEDAVNSGVADYHSHFKFGTRSAVSNILIAADEHLHEHYLERIIEGQDDQADAALLDHYRLIVLRGELKRLEDAWVRGGFINGLDIHASHVVYLRARVAELEGQKQ